MKGNHLAVAGKRWYFSLLPGLSMSWRISDTEPHLGKQPMGASGRAFTLLSLLGSRPTQQWIPENLQSLAVHHFLSLPRDKLKSGEQAILRSPFNTCSAIHREQCALIVPTKGGAGAWKIPCKVCQSWYQLQMLRESQMWDDHVLASPPHPPVLKHQVILWEDPLFCMDSLRVPSGTQARKTPPAPQHCKNITQTSDTSQHPQMTVY